jgi:hypothetical protein
VAEAAAILRAVAEATRPAAVEDIPPADIAKQVGVVG